MRMVRFAVSLAVVVALAATMTPLVAGGAKAQNSVEIERVSQSATLDTRLISLEERADLARSEGEPLLAATPSEPSDSQPDYVAGEVLVKYRDQDALSATVQSRLHDRAGGTPGETVGSDADRTGRGARRRRLGRGRRRRLRGTARGRVGTAQLPLRTRRHHSWRHDVRLAGWPAQHRADRRHLGCRHRHPGGLGPRDR